MAAKKTPTQPAARKKARAKAAAKKTAQVKPVKKTGKKATSAKKTVATKAAGTTKPKSTPAKPKATTAKSTAESGAAKAATSKTNKSATVDKATKVKSPTKKSTDIVITDNETPAPAAPIKSPHSSAFIQKQRQRLLDLRDELVDAMSGMTRDTIRNAPEGSEASGSGMHQGDAGSDAYDRDFALSVLAKEQDALYEIEQALRRIQQGSYGVCELSGEKIPTPRLEAIPFARLTVHCQAQWEKEYGNRRFRPSNEVGFSGGNYLDDEDSESVSLDEDDE